MTNTISSTWFITGASSGIGLALAQAAAGRGDNVVAVARDVAPLGTLADRHGPSVLALPADVRREAEIKHAVSRAVIATRDGRAPGPWPQDRLAAASNSGTWRTTPSGSPR
jgi:NAD(P)-dependent dehydrogenase (short-subunit alcohol dehydrogenase family)